VASRGFRVPPLLVVRLPIGIPVVRRRPWSGIAKAFMPPFWQRKWQHASDAVDFVRDATALPGRRLPEVGRTTCKLPQSSSLSPTTV